MKYFIITWTLISQLLSNPFTPSNRTEFTSFEEMHKYYKQNIKGDAQYKCAEVTELRGDTSYYWFDFED